MKALTSISISAVLLASMAFLGSCKKQLSEPTGYELTSATSAAASDCKPEVLGVIFTTGLGAQLWTNIMQKWYDGSGKITNLKADLGWGFRGFTSDDLYTIKWGTVTYTGNMIRVRDEKNKLVLEVTLDDQQRAMSSIYYNTNNVAERAKYFYSTGTRISSIELENGFLQAGGGLIFNYDGEGNVKRITSLGAYNMELFYDYSKPVSGMLGVHGINEHLKLMEYMDLLEFPVHHQLLSVDAHPVPPNQFPITWRYTAHRLFAGDLVYSYVSTPFPSGLNPIYYTGWACGANTSGTNNNSVNRQKNIITSLEEFQRKYHIPNTTNSK